MSVAEKLTKARKAKGLSQLEVAERLNLSRQAVSRWETGASLPSMENLLALSRLYDVPLNELTEGGGAVPENGSARLEETVEISRRSGKRPAWAGVVAVGAVVLVLLGLLVGWLTWGREKPTDKETVNINDLYQDDEIFVPDGYFEAESD